MVDYVGHGGTAGVVFQLESHEGHVSSESILGHCGFCHQLFSYGFPLFQMPNKMISITD